MSEFRIFLGFSNTTQPHLSRRLTTSLAKTHFVTTANFYVALQKILQEIDIHIEKKQVNYQVQKVTSS